MVREVQEFMFKKLLVKMLQPILYLILSKGQIKMVSMVTTIWGTVSMATAL